jgi:hypothetical protein
LKALQRPVFASGALSSPMLRKQAAPPQATGPFLYALEFTSDFKPLRRGFGDSAGGGRCNSDRRIQQNPVAFR